MISQQTTTRIVLFSILLVACRPMAAAEPPVTAEASAVIQSLQDQFAHRQVEKIIELFHPQYEEWESLKANLQKAKELDLLPHYAMTLLDATEQATLVVAHVAVSETDAEIVLANPLYGDLLIENADVLYRDGDERPDRVETYAMTQDGMTVIGRLQRPVPSRNREAYSFNLLVPGSVQAVTDADGTEVPFLQRPLAENSLATIQYDDLGPAVVLLTITTLQRSLISPTTAGQLGFRANYAFNRAQSLRVIVRYPRSFKLHSLAPPPDVELDGLLIWDRQLRRQQRFQPRILFSP